MASFESSSLNLEQPAAAASDGRPASVGFLDAARWQRLAESGDAREFSEQWLALQCELIEGVAGAVVMLRPKTAEPHKVQAVWPAGTPRAAALQDICDAAMREAQGIVRRAGEANRWQLAYPIVVDDSAYGVAALEVAGRSSEALAGVMRQLQWGSVWLESFVRRRVLPGSARLAAVLQLAAVALERRRFRDAATAVATDLAGTFDCERVSIGIRRGRESQVQALSHSAEFGAKSNLVRLLGAAMDEAADQQAVLNYPSAEPRPRSILHAHSVLARQGCKYICSVPLVDGDAVVGAVTLERNGAPFLREALEQLEHAAAVLGPVLHAKWTEDRWIGAKLWQSLKRGVGRLTGPGEAAFKLAAAGAALIAAIALLVDAPHRLTAQATLEGSVQRAVTAPITGFIADATVRAGDVVDEGQVLATLDQRDLELERLRWTSERERFQREYARALAEGDRSGVRILSAQVEQADAQVRLLDEQLARTRIVAPFAGVVVSGDLSQSLSAPVERGQVLFEVAPLDSYRIVLRVDERDVTALGIGQTGELALAGMPQTPLEFEVTRITPVAVAEEGRNYFEAEAELLAAHELLRPGMEGVAKVSVGERRIGWIYTHRLLHWLDLVLWRVLP